MYRIVVFRSLWPISDIIVKASHPAGARRVQNMARRSCHQSPSIPPAAILIVLLKFRSYYFIDPFEAGFEDFLGASGHKIALPILPLLSAVLFN